MTKSNILFIGMDVHKESIEIVRLQSLTTAPMGRFDAMAVLVAPLLH